MSDAWDRLWTPHRMQYLKGESRPAHTDAGEDCPFCVATELDPDDSLVVTRGTWSYVVLNRYPYNSGHLLVCPYRHVADYTGLTADEVAEVGALTQQGMAALRRVSNAHGFNIGMNQGSVAGAGIAGHLHQHVVPRWGGDTNFLPVIGATKTISQLLAETRALLADAWEA
ncbi:MAG: HIT domain-containing protein [Actinomycetales bacterium]|nr:HIT domain-containing protein [Actinomycetales bacterium]